MKETNCYHEFHVALVVPCFNEEKTIASVIDGFRASMPSIDIYVFDNASTDKTAEVSKAKGVEVIRVSAKGKGNVVRRMFADVDADIYVMVDGDSTYDPTSVTEMIDKLIYEKLDMVVGCRQTQIEIAGAAYRLGHQSGNRMLTGSVRHIFGGSFTDMLSGYRVFSKRYVKSFPVLSSGFEIETELTVHALELKMPIGEVMTPYGARPEGSESKLSTYRDGLRILKTIFRLYMLERPLKFFSIIGVMLAIISGGLSIPVFVEFIQTGFVPRLPTAVLCAALMTLAVMSVQCGVILDSVTRGRQENKRLFYLSINNK